VKAVLLDTHAWAWSLTGDRRLSDGARATIDRAHSVLVSPISFYEIARKVRLGNWPAMEPYIDRLPALLDEQGGGVAALNPVVCATAGILPWPHRDPFDRLIAATAMHFNLPLVSADPVFDGLVARLW
jgi:PIN domain nuclease of toxin-antitoxin system